MMLELQERITDLGALRNGYIIRDGFVFAKTRHEPIFDSLVIRYPQDAIGSSIRSPISERSLAEHIHLINKHRLERAIIICNDLSFITQCPSLNSIAVYPSLDAENEFDFSPLYKMPNIRELYCVTTYGLKDEFHTTIDYSKIDGLCDISAGGVGQFGYEKVNTLQRLWLSGSRRHNDFSTISCSTVLEDITVLQCSVKSLQGLDKYSRLQQLALYHCRSLTDITALKYISKTLRSLTIESCPKITDFSVLNDLCELEHLQLDGNNTLPDLNFLSNMKKLKIFCFTMNVLDGNLTTCKNIPYASCKNRNHYNIKDKDLPKHLPHDDIPKE